MLALVALLPSLGCGNDARTVEPALQVIDCEQWLSLADCTRTCRAARQVHDGMQGFSAHFGPVTVRDESKSYAKPICELQLRSDQPPAEGELASYMNIRVFAYRTEGEAAVSFDRLRGRNTTVVAGLGADAYVDASGPPSLVAREGKYVVTYADYWDGVSQHHGVPANGTYCTPNERVELVSMLLTRLAEST